MSLMQRLRSSRSTSVPVRRPTGDPDNIGGNLTRLNRDAMYYVANAMDVQTLKSWRATCRYADRTGSYALNNRYNAALGKFVKDPTTLRNILRLTLSVISGSTALHVLDVERGDAWSPNDLDIYAPIGSAALVVNYFVEVEGYEVVLGPSPKYPYPTAGFNSVAHLRRGDVDVDIIRSNTISALHPIPYFWASHVMNYLTADSFCIAYPDDTLSGRSLLSPIQPIDHQYPLPRTMRNMKKYKTRGYAFRTRPGAWKADATVECDGGPSCPRTVRYFGDKHCLIGSFTSHGLPPSRDRALPDPSRTVRWWRGGPACGRVCSHSVFDELRSIPTVRTVRTADLV